jgi:hypothetical protein
MGPQSRKNPNFENFETPTWESWDKMTFECWPSGTEYIIRGKVVASLKSGPWWVLWVCLLVIRPCTKCSNYALTNLLFGKSVWVIKLLVNLPSPYFGALACPSTPEVLRAKEHAPTPSSSVVFTFGLPIESIKELGGASLGVCQFFIASIYYSTKCRFPW